MIAEYRGCDVREVMDCDTAENQLYYAIAKRRDLVPHLQVQTALLVYLLSAQVGEDGIKRIKEVAKSNTYIKDAMVLLGM